MAVEWPEVKWPDLTLPPINLWNAPRLGQKEKGNNLVQKVTGKHGISATVICDSITETGIRLTTFELEYPRIIHAEFMTHGMFARNAASSRAIPAAKMREQLTGRPVRFGKNVSGMQDAGEHNEPLRANSGEAFTAEEGWEEAREAAVLWSTRFAEAGYHKQVFNRLTEPFQMMKVICTATEFNNFFWLRNDSAADPSIEELAKCMLAAREMHIPQELKAGEWHLPYVETYRVSGEMHYGIEHENGGMLELTLEQAIKVSAARCAAVSFRNVDYGLEKSEQVHARLIGDGRKHASALEHQATPMKKAKVFDIPEPVNLPQFSHTWEKGITHMDKNGVLWSAKFRGFIQYRKLIDGENVPG